MRQIKEVGLHQHKWKNAHRAAENDFWQECEICCTCRRSPTGTLGTLGVVISPDTMPPDPAYEKWAATGELPEGVR